MKKDNVNDINNTDNSLRFSKDVKCYHESCSECEGTGRNRHTGAFCVHAISCPCPKCTRTSMSVL